VLKLRPAPAREADPPAKGTARPVNPHRSPSSATVPSSDPLANHRSSALAHRPQIKSGVWSLVMSSIWPRNRRSRFE
jgi:hypothetical protein